MLYTHSRELRGLERLAPLLPYPSCLFSWMLIETMFARELKRDQRLAWKVLNPPDLIGPQVFQFKCFADEWHASVFYYTNQVYQCDLGQGRELPHSLEEQTLCSPLTHRMLLEDEAFAVEV
uniref:Uncharacterized protein n=1 Tax=Rhizophora mucronata TaxID=61149 RepID=A0A2P2NJF6_RHIMU